MIVWGTPPTLMPGYRYISALTNNGLQKTFFSAQIPDFVNASPKSNIVG